MIRLLYKSHSSHPTKKEENLQFCTCKHHQCSTPAKGLWHIIVITSSLCIFCHQSTSQIYFRSLSYCMWFVLLLISPSVLYWKAISWQVGEAPLCLKMNVVFVCGLGEQAGPAQQKCTAFQSEYKRGTEMISAVEAWRPLMESLSASQ